MNFQELFNNAIGQISRLTGKTFSENATDAEILAEIEQIPSLAEQTNTLESSVQAMSEEIASLNERLGQIQPGVSETQMSEAIEKAINAYAEKLTALQTSFASEIKYLRDLAEASKVPAGKHEDAVIETAQVIEEPAQKKVIKAFGRERAIK
jgi:predicted nuclease with TOPRIM domain